MKMKHKMITLAAVFLASVCSFGFGGRAEAAGGKILVTYFSYQGHTAGVAREIAAQTGGEKIPAVNCQILQLKAGILGQQCVQGIFPFLTPKGFAFGRAVTGSCTVCPVYQKQSAEIGLAETMKAAQQKALIHIDLSLSVAKRNIMVFNQEQNPVPGLVIKAEPVQCSFRNARRCGLMAGIVAFSMGIRNTYCRLSCVMQEHGDTENRIRRNVLYGTNRVLPEIIKMMVIVLIIADHGRYLREKFSDDTWIGAKNAAGAGTAEKLDKLLTDTFSRDTPECGRKAAKRFICQGIDGEIINRGKAQGAQNPKRVLLKSERGIADTANDTPVQVTLTFKSIHQALG